MIKNPRGMMILIIALLVTTVLFFSTCTTSYHVYRVTDYAGNVRLIKAKWVVPKGPAIEFTLIDGRELFILDAAEVEEITP